MATVPIATRSTNSMPLGHRGLRAAILTELKKSAGLTARELGARLATSLNAVRHHLKELESRDLVRYEPRQQGVGAPAFVYQLTPAGEALFPRGYESTLVQILDQLVEQQGRAAAVAILEARYQNLARQLSPELSEAGPAERIAKVAQLLSNEGYMAEASTSARTGTLIEHNCAIQAVAERFPEICAAEARFLAEVLGADVQRGDHILSGCRACEYKVRFSSQDSRESV